MIGNLTQMIRYLVIIIYLTAVSMYVMIDGIERYKSIAPIMAPRIDYGVLTLNTTSCSTMDVELGMSSMWELSSKFNHYDNECSQDPTPNYTSYLTNDTYVYGYDILILMPPCSDRKNLLLLYFPIGNDIFILGPAIFVLIIYCVDLKTRNCVDFCTKKIHHRIAIWICCINVFSIALISGWFISSVIHQPYAYNNEHYFLYTAFIKIIVECAAIMLTREIDLHN